MTADGSEDEKIKPEGLIGYKVIPPLDSPGPDNAPEGPTSIKVGRHSSSHKMIYFCRNRNPWADPKLVGKPRGPVTPKSLIDAKHLPLVELPFEFRHIPHNYFHPFLLSRLAAIQVTKMSSSVNGLYTCALSTIPCEGRVPLYISKILLQQLLGLSSLP